MVIPPATVARLPQYLKCLESLPGGQTTISSERLADMANVNPAKVRKDLSHLGSYGVRGVGYDLEHLTFQIRAELGLNREWTVVIVGMGNLGSALANYRGFPERGFRIVGLYDVDHHKIGRRVDSLEIRDLAHLSGDAVRHAVAIGLITTPAHAAQDALDALAEAGVKSVLNFAPVMLSIPADVAVRNVDLSTELQILTFYLSRRSAALLD